MNRFRSFLAFTLILLALAFSSLASATTITTFTATISSSDPTQLGRLSRGGVPQDWSGGEPYPGVINTVTTYHYSAYALPSWLFTFTGGYAGYVQVDIDSASPNSFGAAYLNSYDPTNNSTVQATWLGDAGFSGNPFPGDPGFFQIYLPAGDTLVLVFNNTGAGNVGVGDSLNITVEGFVDNAFTDPTGSPVPEPSSILLFGTGLAGLARVIRRRSNLG